VAQLAKAVHRDPRAVKAWEKDEWHPPYAAKQFILKMRRAMRVGYDPQRDHDRMAGQRAIF